MAPARPPRAFPVTGAVWLLVICAVVALYLLIDAGVRTGVGSALLLAPWPLLVLWSVYVVGIASDIRADRAGAEVQNLLRRTSMPWSRVKRIAMRWQIEFALDDGKVVRCFGGPARSRPRRIGPDRAKEDGNENAADGIAKLQRLRLDAQAAPDATAPDAAVVKSWDWPAIVALVVLAAWAVAAVLLTR